MLHTEKGNAIVGVYKGDLIYYNPYTTFIQRSNGLVLVLLDPIELDGVTVLNSQQVFDNLSAKAKERKAKGFVVTAVGVLFMYDNDSRMFAQGRYQICRFENLQEVVASGEYYWNNGLFYGAEDYYV